jgi:rhamnosyltransferase
MAAPTAHSRQHEHQPPRIVVLLATFNGELWLGEQLLGIFGQRGVTVEVVASDDGSTDATPNLLDRAVQDGRPLQVLPRPAAKLGAAGSFFRLLREAALDACDFVALADQDDRWPEGRLGRAIGLLKEHDAQAYSSDVWAFWPDGRGKRLGKGHPQRLFDYLFEPAGPGCTYVMDARLARALQSELRDRPQRFEGLGYHDWLIYAFARAHNHRWTIDPEPSVMYRQHGANELGANAGAKAIPVRWRRLTSGWFRAQVLQIARLWPGSHREVAQRLERLSIADRLWLALHARQLRRRPRDQLALATIALLGVLR